MLSDCCTGAEETTRTISGGRVLTSSETAEDEADTAATDACIDDLTDEFTARFTAALFSLLESADFPPLSLSDECNAAEGDIPATSDLPLTVAWTGCCCVACGSGEARAIPGLWKKRGGGIYGGGCPW